MKNQLIGIVTWFNSANPGTVFQAYALQKYINGIPQFQAELINYRYEAAYNNIIFAHGYGPLSWIIRLLLRYRKYKSSSFQKKNVIYYPKEMVRRQDLKTINDRYDWIILGSDQLWNVGFTDFDKTFFLDFVKGKKKGAYAPSLGKDEWPDEYKDEIKRYLADFSFIGVREKNSVNVVQELTGIPVHWSLDPTFLLNKEDWSKIARKVERGDYIFEYSITKNPVIRTAAEKLSKMTGLPIIEHGGIRKRVPTAKRMPHPSADTWLGYLMGAKYVVTDSFHGCAFSINTNTTFFAIAIGNGARIYSILELFGLQDRLLKDGTEIDASKSINWNPVNCILDDRRKECQEWLKNNLLA
jgi:hypothetical protein